MIRVRPHHETTAAARRVAHVAHAARVALPALALLALAGCAAKRVVHGEVADPEVGAPVAVAPSAERARAPVSLGPKRLPPAAPGAASGAASTDEDAAVIEPTPPPAAVPANRDRGHQAAALARRQVGKPYQWGAAGPDRFDCSGLVQYVFRALGVPLPRVTGAQASAGVHVDRDELRPGDVVFFAVAGSSIDHAGIYLGHAEFVHAPRRHQPVRVDSLDNSWWRRRYKGARRIVSADS